MPHTEKSLREQLLAARAGIQRQIEILQSGPASIGKGGAFIDNSEALVDLSSTLRELNESLSGLGPEDA